VSAAAASFAGFVQLVFGDVVPGTTPAYHRMTGLGQEVNEFGVITATALLGVVGLFVLARGRDRRLIGAIGVLLIGGLLLSGSLSAMGGLVIGLVVAVALAGRPFLRLVAQRRVLIPAGVAAAVILAGLSIGVATGRVSAPWSRLLQTTSTAGGTGLAHQQATLWFRIRTLRTGWTTVRDHPLFGVGENPDGVALAHGTYVHDTPLGAWAGLGLLAMIGVILCFAAPFVSVRGLLRARPDIRPLVIGLTGAVTAFTVYALANPTLYRRYGWLPALFVIALAQPALAWRRAASADRSSKPVTT
jgi:O-antigen ligase